MDFCHPKRLVIIQCHLSNSIVRVECTPSDMLVSLSLANDFRGRIYATGNPQACFELGTGSPEMTLRIPLGTECGTVQQVSPIIEYSVRSRPD